LNRSKGVKNEAAAPATGYIDLRRSLMSKLVITASLLALSCGPALAGPCGQQIAEFEKALLAKHEGAGTILAEAPRSESGAASPTQAANARGGNPAGTGNEAGSDNQALNQLQAAKELDAKGQEAECMKAVGSVENMATGSAK
jgi:hypothetical protein